MTLSTAQCVHHTHTATVQVECTELEYHFLFPLTFTGSSDLVFHVTAWAAMLYPPHWWPRHWEWCLGLVHSP